MNNKLKGILGIALGIAAVLAAPLAVQAAECPGGAEYTGRECSPTTDSCDGAAATTEATARIGGQGSIGTETAVPCGESPATDAEGNIVEADVTFRWTRSSETAGTLELLVCNVTCDAAFESQATITEIWFNTPASISGCELTSATRDPDTAEEVSVNWGLGDDETAGCIGEFDWSLKRGGGSVASNGALPDDCIEFVIDCAGTEMMTAGLTACDIANDGSTAEIGEREAQIALHFQRSDDDAERSTKVTSNCTEDLYVELASIETTPSDGEVRIDWTTAMEIDNAGFYLVRRNVLTGEIARLNSGLIPAQGDLNQGAAYSFTDGAAINGVRYEYRLVDVEFSGLEGIHNGLVAVANPTHPKVRLIAPEYGAAALRWGVRPTFAWAGLVSRDAVVQVASDPTFANALAVSLRGRKGTEITLNAAQTRIVEEMASRNAGVVYWRVLDTALGSAAAVSETFAVGYGVARPADSRDVVRFDLADSSDKLDSARSKRTLVGR